MADQSFTHAWVLPHEIEESQWAALRVDATRVLRAASGRLDAGIADDASGALRGPDGLGPPAIGTNRIAFNGSAFRGAAGDPFILERQSATGVMVHVAGGAVGRAVRRCDTRGQPYDLAVCALLLTAQLHLRNLMRLGSTGGLREGWHSAADVVRLAIAHDGQLLQTERGLIVWSSPAQRTQARPIRNSA